MNRRRFIGLSLGVGALAVAGERVLSHGLKRVERKGWALGAEVSLIVYHESRGAANLLEEEEEEKGQFVLREGPIGISTGRATPVRQATDEQALPEDLVEEGVEEAAHDQMVEGNAESRRRDRHFDDQLPGA